MKRLLFALLLAFPLAAQAPVDGRWQEAPARPAPPVARRAWPGVAREFALPPLDLAAHRVANRRGMIPKGLARPAPSEAASAGEWVTASDGAALWRLTLRSPGAVAVRVHLFGFTSGRLWVSGRGPYSPGDGDFWSPTVDGDRLTLELETNTASSGPPFTLASLAHLWEDVTPGRDVAACQLDYKCYPVWGQAGESVASILFQSDDDRNFYVCSGSLLTTRNASLLPYFLTAHHCVATGNEARSVQAFWFYETSACNSSPPTRSSATRIDGAQLLATGSQVDGDFSLLLLSSAPPRAFYAGWEARDPDLGSSVTGIHHPGGSWKRITFGQRSADRNASVGGEFAPASRYFQIHEIEGRTEGGSSGSPLFDPNQRVTGVLSYGDVAPPGSSVCDLTSYSSGYGRFSVMYPVLRPWLEDQPPPPITVTPATLSFRVTGTEVSPAAQTVRIDSTATTPVNFTLESSASWLKISRTSGAVSAGAPVSIDVTLDPAAFSSSGQFSATLTLRAGTAAPINVPVSADVAISASSIRATVTPNPVYERTPDAEGYRWFYELRVSESAGVAARLTQLRIEGVDYSAQIASFFGSDRLAPFGSLSASLRTRGLTVPAERLFELGGVDAGGLPWSQQVTAQFLGRRQQAVLQLSLSPSPVTQDPNSEDCPWRHDIVLTEENGYAADLTRFVAGGFDLSSDLASWFGARRIEANGRLRAGFCWRNLVPPAVLGFEAGGRDERGNDVSASVSGRFVGVPSAQSAVHVAPERVTLRAAAGVSESLRATITVTPPPGAPGWSARWASPSPQWASVFPLSGSAAASIALSASVGSLPAGRYSATLLIDIPAGQPSQVQVPVELVVGATAPAAPSFSSAGMVNAASFAPRLAPGMLFSLFGLDLATSEAAASRVPLPFTLGGATVRVNGVLCPMLYASPRQINAQLPYATRPGRALVTVNTEGRETEAAVDVQSVAPGLFTADGARPTPQPAGRRGQVLIAFATGAGLLDTAVADGAAPAALRPEDLPKPMAEVKVTVAGLPADLLFAGVPPGLVGVMQINFRIPDAAPTGPVPLVLTVGGVVANTATLTVQP